MFHLTKDDTTIDVVHKVIEFIALVWVSAVVIKDVARLLLTFWLGSNMDWRLNILSICQ